MYIISDDIQFNPRWYGVRAVEGLETNSLVIFF